MATPRVRFGPVAGDLELELAVPEGALPEDDAALPSLDVSGVPGAKVVVRRGFVKDGVTVRAACVRAGSDRWAPGVEGLVLERATAIAASAAPGIGPWSLSPGSVRGDRIEQDLEGQGTAAGAPAHGFIHHELAFAGPRHDVALCSVVCIEREGEEVCRGLRGRTEMVGTLAAPPDPSLAVRAIFFAAERPYEAGTLGGLLALFAAGVLLARRPRPRR